MKANENEFILGKKTKDKLISDYDTRNIQSFLSGLIWIAGIVILIILETNGYRGIATIVVIISFIIASVLFYLGKRCPICDHSKLQDYFDIGIFRFRKGNYICQNCQLSDDQIHEYFDLMIRGVEIDKEKIARFNKQDL